MRYLTTKFMSYDVGQYEKKTGKGIMDLLDIGNLEVNKIVTIIQLGNHKMEPEAAYERLDQYLSADEEHSLITAFFDLLDELDKDLKIFKSCGVKVDEIKEQFKDEVKKRVDNTNITNQENLADVVEFNKDKSDK